MADERAYFEQFSGEISINIEDMVYVLTESDGNPDYSYGICEVIDIKGDYFDVWSRCTLKAYRHIPVSRIKRLPQHVQDDYQYWVQSLPEGNQ